MASFEDSSSSLAHLSQLSQEKNQISPIRKQLRPRTYDQRMNMLDFKRTYIKVPLEKKTELFNLVYKGGCKIKDAAKQLGIKYATAKTIVFHNREKRKAHKAQGEKVCSYTELYEEKPSKLKIISSTANDIVQAKEYILLSPPSRKYAQIKKMIDINEQQDFMLSSFESKVKTHAPLVYVLVFVIFSGTFMLSADIFISTTPPFQYMTYTLIISLIINYTLIRNKQMSISNKIEIHFVALSFSIVICLIMLAFKKNILPSAFCVMNLAWIVEIYYEIYVQGERYTKSEIISYIGITFGSIICVWDFTFSLIAILLGIKGALLIAHGAHHLRRICDTNCLQIYNTYLVYQLILFGLCYPIQEFAAVNTNLLVFCVIFGIVSQIFMILLIRAFQTGQTVTIVSLIFLVSMAAATVSINHSFSFLKLIGIIISLAFSSFLFIDHKTYIEIGGFNIEPEENPYFELQKFQIK